jgi:rhamnogalacturonan acetylesterase
VKPGDWVIIEFGHNDGGSPYPASSDIGRADCPGAGQFHLHFLQLTSLNTMTGNETCPTVYACVDTLL